MCEWYSGSTLYTFYQIATDYTISFLYRDTQKHTEDEVHDKIILNQTLSKHLLHFMHIG